MKRRKRVLKRKIKFMCFLLFILGIFLIYNQFFIQKENTFTQEVGENLDNNSPIPTDLTIRKLKQLAKQEKRVTNIIENRDKYPDDILEMLVKNIDMMDYVLDFPTKKGNVYADTIKEVTKEKWPLLLQYDTRWGYGIYGDNVLAVNGCGPTVLSMVVAGLTGRNDVTPYDIAIHSVKKGYYESKSGTSWSLMTLGMKEYGIIGTEVSLSKSIMMNELEEGHPIVCSMRKGDFTTTGHFILLVGVQDGKFIVHDPNSKERSQKLWDYETLEYQIRNLWSFQMIQNRG